MVLGGQPPGRVGRRRLFARKGAARAALFHGPRRPLRCARARARRVEPRSRRTRSPTGGCVTKSAAEPVLRERVDREERLGRRAALELDELGRLLEPASARRRGRAASRRASPRAGRPRTRASARRAGGRTPPRPARARRAATARASRRSGSSRGATAASDDGRRLDLRRRGGGRARSRARARPRARPAGRRRRSPC